MGKMLKSYSAYCIKEKVLLYLHRLKKADKLLLSSVG